MKKETLASALAACMALGVTGCSKSGDAAVDTAPSGQVTMAEEQFQAALDIAATGAFASPEAANHHFSGIGASVRSEHDAGCADDHRRDRVHYHFVPIRIEAVREAV